MTHPYGIWKDTGIRLEGCLLYTSLQRIVYVVFDTMSMTFAMFSKNLEYLDRVIRDVVL